MRRELSRFFAHVEVDDCWIWTAGRTKQGYGFYRPDGGRSSGVLAHRWCYESLVGFIPVGMQLDHLCRVKACVNPDHLQVVSGGENTRRGWRAKVVRCPAGHLYTPDNTRVHRNGARSCKTCARENDWNERRAEQQRQRRAANRERV